MGENDVILNLVEQEARQHLASRKAGGWYSREGDCFFYYAEDVPYQAVRLAGLVTVFEALDDGRPVGIQIKGVRSLLSDYEQLQVFVQKQADVGVVYLLSFALCRSKELPERQDLVNRVFSTSAGWQFPTESLQGAAT